MLRTDRGLGPSPVSSHTSSHTSGQPVRETASLTGKGASQLLTCSHSRAAKWIHATPFRREQQTYECSALLTRLSFRWRPPSPPPLGVGCHDRNPTCRVWAKTGECKARLSHASLAAPAISLLGGVRSGLTVA